MKDKVKKSGIADARQAFMGYNFSDKSQNEGSTTMGQKPSKTSVLKANNSTRHTHRPYRIQVELSMRRSVNLKNVTEIVIKPTDKGSAVVVMDKHDYKQEGLRQLSDENFYLPQDECLTNKHNSIIGTKINEMVANGEIMEKTVEYLFVSEPRTPQLYLLPKIHKGANHIYQPLNKFHNCWIISYSLSYTKLNCGSGTLAIALRFCPKSRHYYQAL